MFIDAGATVLGISTDTPEANAKFAKEQRLPFPLLTDQVHCHAVRRRSRWDQRPSVWMAEQQHHVPSRRQGGFLRKSFGIKADLFGALAGRQTFVIDEGGVCRMSFNNQFQPEKHYQEALDCIKTL